LCHPRTKSLKQGEKTTSAKSLIHKPGLTGVIRRCSI
jgi:hypothetical protein